MFDRECVAYHEAGHAVVAWLGGLGTDHITISDKEGEHELTTLEGMPVEALIACCYGGMVADEIRRGRPYLRIQWRRYYHDIFTAEALASDTVMDRAKRSGESTGSILAEMLQAGYRRAQKDLGSHWPNVEAVAVALQQRTTLTGDEVMSLIMDAFYNDQGDK
jgi:ATP-dependent Zn protease